MRTLFAILSLLIVYLVRASEAFAGPLDDQPRIEVAMKAALPAALCERGGRYKAACYQKRDADDPLPLDSSIVLTHENHVIVSIPFHAKYVGRLEKFYRDLGLSYDAAALSRCWSNSYIKKMNLNQGPAEWVTPEAITICDQGDRAPLQLEIYANNRF